MNGKSKNKLTQSLQPTIYCPITNRPVSPDNWKQFSVPGGQAIWWHCSECLGWHVVIGDNQEMYNHAPISA